MHAFLDVYETMLGLREPEACVAGIEDAFGDDLLCAREYEKMRQAYERLCLRLGVAEDQDLDTMIYSMEAIQEELCQRMYFLSINPDPEHTP